MAAESKGLIAVETAAPLIIRYDGLDADNHRVEIRDLADSLRGLARLLAVTANFAATQKLIQHKDAQPIRVLIGPPRDGCVVFEAALSWVEQHALVTAIVSGLTVNLVGYVVLWAAGQKEEMKHLRAIAETAIKEMGSRDEAVLARLMDTVDRMAETLKPAVRQAVKPVGKTASTLTVSGAGDLPGRVTIDKQLRDAIDATTPPDIGEETVMEVRFAEINLDTKACRLILDETSEAREPGEITDPEILIPNNAYAVAFAAKRGLTVRAKPTLRNGIVERWYISGHLTAQ